MSTAANKMTATEMMNSKIVIDDEYSPIVRNFIKNEFHKGNYSESKIVKMVKEYFVYDHASVYITDMIHHCKS